MLLGIISAVFLALALCRVFLRKKHSSLIRRLHAIAGIAAIGFTAAHLVTAIHLFKQRPVIVLITGFALLITLIVIALNGAVKWKGWYRWHRLLALLSVILVVAHITVNIVGLTEYQQQVKSITIPNLDTSKVADGEYIGECNVTFIYAKVRVTVKSGEIADIKILEHRNERGAPAERITDEIINQKTIDVDAVTGATNSSKVIKMAVYNALKETQ
jgi:uncharacterized protein with FMN-binding domain